MAATRSGPTRTGGRGGQWNGGREADVETGGDSRGRLGIEALCETLAFEDGVLLG